MQLSVFQVFEKLGAAIIILLSMAVAKAQLPEGSMPSSTNIRMNDCPCIFPDNTVLFKLLAPNAKKVQIDLGKLYDMQLDTGGRWSVRTGEIEEGFHYYSLVIDDVKVADPASESYYGMGRMASAIDISEKNLDIYAIKQVPHGNVLRQTYYSNTTKSWRELTVYTPPNYNTGKKTFPVMYIQHGGGEDHHGWSQQGKINYILDNLIADKKAVPMIIVMANGNVSLPGVSPGYSDDAMNLFKEEMVGNIIPFIEKNYRTKKGPQHRAMAGLSMGGGQSFYTGFRNPGVFGNVGIFSTGLFGGIGRQNAAPFDVEKAMPGLASNTADFNKKFAVMYISVGEQDPRIDATKNMVDDLKSKGLNMTFSSFPGGHEWQVWRKSVHDFAQLLFKPKQ